MDIKLIRNQAKETVDNNYIFLADTNELLQLFSDFVVYYADHIKTRKHVAMDFEFNKMEVALMQINFGKIHGKVYIWVLDPKQIIDTNIFVSKILLNSKIYKVLHGSESLDLKYIYNEMLNNDRQKIIKFTKRVIDTRFLCEYYRLDHGEKGKCSLYYALLYFGTITRTQYDELLRIDKLKGPIQNIVWDSKTISKYNLMYAYYDVLYLLGMIEDIYKKILNEGQTFRNYYYIIEVIRFVLLEKKGITNLSSKSKAIVDPLNSFFLDNKIVLRQVYNQISEDMIVIDGIYKVDIGFIKANDYIRGTINYLLMCLTYHVLLSKHLVYQNNNTISQHKVDIDFIFNGLLEFGFKRVYKLLLLFKVHVGNWIVNFLVYNVDSLDR